MTTYVTQPSAMPTRKVTWATMAALVSSVSADILVSALPVMGSVDPAELELVIETVLVTVATGLAGWWVRDRA